MKNLIILFFVLFVNVAGFAVEGKCGNGSFVEDVCVETEFSGGNLDFVQTLYDVNVIVTENEGNLGGVVLKDDFGRIVSQEVFEGNAIVTIDKKSLHVGSYTVYGMAGSTVKAFSFEVE